MQKIFEFPAEKGEVEKLRAIFREIPAGLALLRGPDFVFEMANADYLHLIGNRDIVGKTLIEALPEMKDQAFPDLLRSVYNTGKNFQAREVEALIQRDINRPGELSKLYVDLNYSRILGDDDKPYGIFVFAVDVTEKVNARASIQIEKQKLESFFLSSSAALAILRGPESIFEKANASYLNLFEGRNIIDKPVLEAVPELRGQKFPELLAEVYHTGNSYSEVEAVAYLRKNDSAPIEKKYFDQAYTRISDSRGNKYGVLIQAVDVTERVESRLRLEASTRDLATEKRKLEAMVEESPSAISLMHGPDYIFEMANVKWRELVSDREYIGRPYREVYPELVDTPAFESIRDTFATGNPFTAHEMKLKVKSRNGELEDQYFNYTNIRVLDGDGKPYGVYCQAVNVTDQVKAVQALRESEENLRQSEAQLKFARQELESFLTQAPVGIGILSGSQHVYQFLNPAFLAMCFGGRPTSDFYGKPVRQAVPELAGQGFYEILDEVYQTGKTFHGAKLRATMRQANGLDREVFVNFSYQAKRDQAGRTDGVLVVIYEVTDQVNEQREIELLAENLQKAILARDTFLGIASHELNTPLTSLKLQAQMNKKLLDEKGMGAFSAEKIRRLIDNTLFQGDRLSRLVNDMLDISRISSGKLTIRLANNNLSFLVHDTLERFAPQLEATGCPVTEKIAPEIYAALDPSRIEQVLTNFITNAMKYAPGKGLTVILETEDGVARVKFRDEGEGIAAENHERIFGRFERATDASQVSGLGLGLYICKQIILEHHGNIYVESKIGEGSTFVFELPLVEKK